MWACDVKTEILEIFVEAQRAAADRRRRVRLETIAPTFELRADYVPHGGTSFLPGCGYSTLEVQLLRALVHEQRLNRAGARVGRARQRVKATARRLEKRGLIKIEWRVNAENRQLQCEGRKPFYYAFFTEFGVQELVRIFELELASDYCAE